MSTVLQERLAEELAKRCHRSKGAAVRAAGYSKSTARHAQSAVCRTVDSQVPEARAEHLAAMAAVGVGPLAYAKAVKRGLRNANPGWGRLYAEITGLVGQEQAQQVFVIVLGAFETVIGKFAPEKRGPALREFAEALQAARDGKTIDLPAAEQPSAELDKPTPH